MSTLGTLLRLTRVATIIYDEVERRIKVIALTVFAHPSPNIVEFIDLAHDVDNFIAVSHKWNIHIENVCILFCKLVE